ncbi:hypothetical protein [Stenotrophomonas maltophilia]|uniref:hypothetical protein n=1 Tax=Stenotrophomonas maltophilia TaxID=40324 RepID=UPI0021C9076E|nr:hypothetical protein [Stenotrophomonas maltophilia]MDT3500914.1 hypothetical protein [Stenotrophomonas maltophilia]
MLNTSLIEEAIVRIAVIAVTVGMVVAAYLPMPALAQSDDHGTHMSQAGLGQAYPATVNLSQDPNWLVYGFQRDGISYFQVNDLAGRVQLIVGNADGTFWILPAGETQVPVSLPGQPSPVPAKAVRSVVYRGSNFVLVRYNAGSSALWAIEGR